MVKIEIPGDIKKKLVSELTVVEFINLITEYTKVPKELTNREKSGFLRRKIYDYIQLKERVSVGEIGRKFELKYDIARHHLNMMVKDSKISVQKNGSIIAYTPKKDEQI